MLDNARNQIFLNFFIYTGFILNFRGFIIYLGLGNHILLLKYRESLYLMP